MTSRETPAAALESLKLQVRGLRTDVDEVRDKVRDLPGDDSDRLDKVEKMLERFTTALGEAPQPFLWELLPADEFAERKGQVFDWVRDYLCARYGGPTGPGRYLKGRGCWWTHLDVRDHITAAWLAWTAAYLHAGRRHTDPDDWLNVRLPRLAVALEKLLGERGDCAACKREADLAERRARAQF